MERTMVFMRFIEIVQKLIKITKIKYQNIKIKITKNEIHG